MIRHGAHVVRFILSVLILTPLFVGQSALGETTSPQDPVPQSLLLKFLADNETFTLVDARSPEEFATSHINGAINLPHDASDDDLSSLLSDLSAPIVVYCKTGKRAGQLKAKLIQSGYTNVRVLLPEQIVWFDGMAVFNCGTPATGPSDRIFESSTVDNNREGKL